MKVLLVNGSPHEKGCTYTALEEAARTLNDEGVETEVFWIGTKAISGCLSCGYCATHDHCVIDDRVNTFLKMAQAADGFIFGSPVHYASAAGAMVAFMDRLFYAAPHGTFYLKPGACVVSARRGGNTAAFDQMNKYLTISQMPVVSSQYWNMVHGFTPEDVKKDLEGLQTMRTLARNMAWLLKCKKAAQAAGIPLPKQEERVGTHFIR